MRMSVALQYERHGIHQGQAGAWFKGRVYGQTRERHKFISYADIMTFRDLEAIKKVPVGKIAKGGDIAIEFTVANYELAKALKGLEKISAKLCAAFDKAAPDYERPMQFSSRHIYNKAAPLSVFTDGCGRAETLSAEHIKTLLGLPQRAAMRSRFSDSALTDALNEMQKFEAAPLRSKSTALVVSAPRNPMLSPQRHFPH